MNYRSIGAITMSLEVSKKWTQSAIDCYNIGCQCEKCGLYHLIFKESKSKCKMKYTVIELVRALGVPKETNKKESRQMAKEFIDGAIDEPIRQGRCGDCWLLSAILALNATKKGREALQDSVDIDSEGNIIISFYGLYDTNGDIVSYTITKNEIDENFSESSPYSKGSKDLLVFELAFKKLEQDIKTQKNLPDDDESVRIIVPENIATINTAPEFNYIEGGYQQRAMFFLTGMIPEIIESDFNDLCEIDGKKFSGLSLEEITNFLNKAENGDFAACFSLYADPDSLTKVGKKRCGLHRRIDLNRNLFYLELPIIQHGNIKVSGHALAITGIDTENQTIKITNPLHSEMEYLFNWKQFADMGVYEIIGIQL